MQEILSKKILGKRIKSLRLERAYAQVDVANLLNLSRSNYSQIELGNQYPTFHTLCALSRHYKKSYEWLLHGEENNEPQAVFPVAGLMNELETTLKNFSLCLEKLENELQSIKIKIDVS
ncbi:transcriptional regulator with XRE-family HTH domain [Pedobacter cryoconitis]|uniref:Transcriptional regulator with XRE-family HTH domain n=1 Tax=Pedobacter cryoconitis TaxID=188932 RepID=A0A7W8YNR8_9SPHI|nr:helix-turn-helix transcriptional regulator [Pedobacter cryoconitis]MBB5619023.1 transcriptional regulator with XRE-family HTH domain [Pedobacter cryoconitis]MBB5644320.1 transcriptional regulator with XRE-family HTH domain [Pedobacter cryoconitis]